VLRRTALRCDDGSILPLIIGYVAIAAALIVIGVDVSKVYLARRALGAAADSAALAATGGVDQHAVYDGRGVPCGHPLPLAPSDAAQRAAASIRDARTNLRHTMVAVGPPRTTVRGGAVSVVLTASVRVPFGGTYRITESASARSPVAGAC
jgi:hypothetical protein